MAIDAGATSNLLRAIEGHTALKRGQYDSLTQAVGNVSASLQDALLRAQDQQDQIDAEARADAQWRERFEMGRQADMDLQAQRFQAQADAAQARDKLAQDREMADRRATWDARMGAPIAGPAIEGQPLPGLGGPGFQPAVPRPTPLPPEATINRMATDQARSFEAAQREQQRMREQTAEAQEQATEARIMEFVPSKAPMGETQPPDAETFFARTTMERGRPPTADETNAYFKLVSAWAKTQPKPPEPGKPQPQPVTVNGRTYQPNDPLYSQAVKALGAQTFPRAASDFGARQSAQASDLRNQLQAVNNQIDAIDEASWSEKYRQQNAARRAELVIERDALQQRMNALIWDSGSGSPMQVPQAPTRKSVLEQEAGRRENIYQDPETGEWKVRGR